MSEEEKSPVIKAKLTGVIKAKRLPNEFEGHHIVSTVGLLYKGANVGEINMNLTEGHSLGDTYAVELTFYPISTEEYNERIGWAERPETERVEPV